MKKLKKLAAALMTGAMVLGVLFATPVAQVSAHEQAPECTDECNVSLTDDAAVYGTMRCFTCGATLQTTFGACAIRNSAGGYCFAGTTLSSCQKCGIGWYKCNVGHTNYPR